MDATAQRRGSDGRGAGPVDVVGLDADDTLWHCETVFRVAQQGFAAMLSGFAGPERVEHALRETERRNLGLYGYGAKGFTLSMIETALAVSEGRVGARVVGDILAAGRAMMSHPVETMPGARAALTALAATRRLVLVTKGDLVHQEAKLAASGLGDLFTGVEVVSEKTPDTYRRVFARHGTAPDRAAMVGNSVRSDVLPVLEAGCWAALIPYPLVWDHEAADAPHGHPRFAELASLADVPAWLDGLNPGAARPPRPA